MKVPIATPEDMILFKLSAWREKDIPDARAILKRHGDRLDTAYLEKWARWMGERNPIFREVTVRLRSLIAGGRLPPAVPEP